MSHLMSCELLRGFFVCFFICSKIKLYQQVAVEDWRRLSAEENLELYPV